MSWGIKTTGKPANVIAEVNAIQFMPQGLKDAVANVAAEVKDADYNNGLFVESYGHIGGSNSNAKLIVEAVHIAPEPPAPAPAAEAPAATEAAAPTGGTAAI